MRKRETGFTIVELLIVIVVIGILAAITIVAYNGISSKATIASLQADLENSNKQLIAYLGTSSTGYPTALDCSASPAANTICLKASGSTTYQYSVNNTLSTPTYCLTATNGTTSYYFGTAYASPSSGGCPGHGVGGVPPITNMLTNPNFETNASSWGNNGTTTVSQSSDYAHSGSYALKLSATGSTNVGTVMGGPILVAGQSYVFSAYVYFPTAWPSGLRACAWGSAVSSLLCGSPSSLTTGSWQRVSVAFQATNSANVTLYVYNGLTPAPSSGMIAYVDDAMITQGSTLYAYADGNSTNWIWNGPANAATSTGPPQ